MRMFWVQKEARHFFKAFIESWRILKLALIVLGKNQHILLYPLTSLGILLVTLPLLNGLLFSIVSAIESLINSAGFSNWIFSQSFNTGAVIISLIYAATVSSFFSCMTAATMISRLEHHHTAYGSGFHIIRNHYRRIIRFGLVSPLLGIIYLVSNRPRTVRRLIEVVPPAVSINTALLAPSILSTDKNVRDTMRDATATLGKGWRQQLVFKAALLAVILTLLSISFLPHQVGSATEDTIGEASHTVELILKLTIALSLFIASRILGSIFTATLYYTMKNNKS